MGWYVPPKWINEERRRHGVPKKKKRDQDTQLREDEGTPQDANEGSSQDDNCTSTLKSRLEQSDSEACKSLSFLPENGWVSLALSLSAHVFLGSCAGEVPSLLSLLGSAEDTCRSPPTAPNIFCLDLILRAEGQPGWD